ncbi:nodulin MtN21 /EamA-like transporter family protein [Salvia divinorum]|uniref:Nodulin MtN21 /EamA-like transporter family protein n=1 Tax=Salvia divinorum TaxID=28513 RepID=A0ABD1G5N1_SALDI
MARSQNSGSGERRHRRWGCRSISLQCPSRPYASSFISPRSQCLAQLTGYTGINYTSAEFSSAMLNLSFPDVFSVLNLLNSVPHRLDCVVASAYIIVQGVNGSAFQRWFVSSLLGSIIIVVGFYSVMCGKAKEVKAPWKPHPFSGLSCRGQESKAGEGRRLFEGGDMFDKWKKSE